MAAAGLGCQDVKQTQVADLGVLACAAEEAQVLEITMDGQAVDAVAPAIEDGSEGPVVGGLVSRGVGIVDADPVLATVPDGQPAALSRVEIGVVTVPAVQADGPVTGAGPGAAVTVRIEAEILYQLIPEAASLGAATLIRDGVGPVHAAGAGQVVAHVVQFFQAADLYETIAIGIGYGGSGKRHPGHPAQAAGQTLHNDEDIVGSAICQAGQVQAGPARHQALAGDGDDASLPGYSIPDIGGPGPGGIPGQHGGISGAEDVADQANPGAEWQHLGRGGEGNGAAAIRDQGGAGRRGHPAVGAVKAVTRGIAGRSARGRLRGRHSRAVIVRKLQCRQLPRCVQIPGTEGLACCQVP